ncbi:hypothetical protein E2320_014040, partial [Naja naja]
TDNQVSLSKPCRTRMPLRLPNKLPFPRLKLVGKIQAAPRMKERPMDQEIEMNKQENHGRPIFAIFKNRKSRLFLRSIDEEGKGFEYAIPIPLGSVVLVETKVEKVEEKKIFLSGSLDPSGRDDFFPSSDQLQLTLLLANSDPLWASHKKIPEISIFYFLFWKNRLIYLHALKGEP